MATQCIDTPSTYLLGPLVVTSGYSCDPWAVPHLLLPFLATIWTRNIFIGWFFAFLGEFVEYMLPIIYGSFPIFLDSTEDRAVSRSFENLAGSYLDDIGWMGLYGAILGFIFYQTIDSPIMLNWRDALNRRVLYFLFYLFCYIIGIALGPALLFEITVGASEFPFGRLGHVIFWLATFVFILVFQPKDVWANYTTRQQAQYWVTAYLVCVVLSVQNLWSWFFSGAIQASFVAGLILIALVIAGLIKKKWVQRFTLDWTLEWATKKKVNN